MHWYPCKRREGEPFSWRELHVSSLTMCTKVLIGSGVFRIKFVDPASVRTARVAVPDSLKAAAKLQQRNLAQDHGPEKIGLAQLDLYLNSVGAST